MKPGIYPNIPESEYRKSEGVNQSALKQMLISPAHYRASVTEPPKEPTDAQVIGTLTHRVILEGKGDFVIEPEDVDLRTKAGKEWLSKQGDVRIVKSEIAKSIAGMRESVLRHPVAKAILESKGDNEVSCWAADPATGLLLKGRADRLTTDANNYTVVADLKTVQRGEAGKESFSKAIFNWGYAFQAYFYANLLFQASYFVFIVVEKESPFACCCYSLSPEAINYGGRQVRKCLDLVRQCEQSGKWPAYNDDLSVISLPDWVMRKEEV